jgi:uncharacterized ion transporter superfamily protein YfcC
VQVSFTICDNVERQFSRVSFELCHRQNANSQMLIIFIIIVKVIIIIITITYVVTAIEFSFGGSSPYNSRDKTNKNKYT